MYIVPLRRTCAVCPAGGAIGQIMESLIPELFDPLRTRNVY